MFAHLSTSVEMNCLNSAGELPDVRRPCFRARSRRRVSSQHCTATCLKNDPEHRPSPIFLGRARGLGRVANPGEFPRKLPLPSPRRQARPGPGGIPAPALRMENILFAVLLVILIAKVPAKFVRRRGLPDLE